jgi:hypothetical protein
VGFFIPASAEVTQRATTANITTSFLFIVANPFRIEVDSYLQLRACFEIGFSDFFWPDLESVFSLQPYFILGLIHSAAQKQDLRPTGHL